MAEHETSSEGVEGSEVSGSVSQGGTFHLRERIELSMAAELMDVVEEEEAMIFDAPAASNQVQSGEGEEAAEDEVPVPEVGLPAASSSDHPGPGHAEPEPEGHPRLEGVRLPEPPGPDLHPDPYPGYLRVVQHVFTTPAGSVYHRRRQCGKLRCARRVYTHDSCPDCCEHFNGGLIRLEGGRFHCWLHDRLTAVTTSSWRPCAECGGG